MQYLILGRIALAIVLGAIIGLERELAGKPAGFRTHMLVAAAAALLMAAGDIIVENIDPTITQLRVDPIRVIEAVITGVSFLGAGTIIRHSGRRQVEGLTTAASLLFVAAVSIMVALDQFILAVGATILTLVVLRGGKVLEIWLEKRLASRRSLNK